MQSGQMISYNKLKIYFKNFVLERIFFSGVDGASY